MTEFEKELINELKRSNAINQTSCVAMINCLKGVMALYKDMIIKMASDDPMLEDFIEQIDQINYNLAIGGDMLSDV